MSIARSRPIHVFFVYVCIPYLSEYMYYYSCVNTRIRFNDRNKTWDECVRWLTPSINIGKGWQLGQSWWKNESENSNYETLSDLTNVKRRESKLKILRSNTFFSLFLIWFCMLGSDRQIFICNRYNQLKYSYTFSDQYRFSL